MEVLNVATVAGLPLALAAFLWGNRLLPLRLAERAEWEIHIFFIAWGAALLHALCRPRRLAWTEQFCAGAILLLLLPLGNALTTRRGLDHSLSAADWGMAGFDIGLLGRGIGLAMLAWASAPERRRHGRAALPMKAVSDAAE